MTSRISLDVAPAAAATAAPSSSASMSSSSSSKSKVTLTWHDLRYTVYPNGKTKPCKEVLKGLTGAALPHHVMAFMAGIGTRLPHPNHAPTHLFTKHFFYQVYGGDVCETNGV